MYTVKSNVRTVTSLILLTEFPIFRNYNENSRPCCFTMHPSTGSCMAFGGVYSWQLSPWRRLPLPCRTHWAGSRTSWCGPRVGSQISTKVDWDVKMGVGGRSENGKRLCSAFSCVSLSWYVGRCCINASLSMWIMRHLVLLLAVAWCGNIGQLIVELICLGWASSFEFDFRCDDNKQICLMSHLLSDVFVRCRFPSAFCRPAQ
jgi:hypothetical protein